jgi:hypothetical protein
MPSMRWRLLLMGLTLLGPAGLCGCYRAQGIVVQKPTSDERSENVVARGKADDDEVVTDGFRFPDDKGGELLARLLPPALDAAALKDHVPHAPPRSKAPPNLEVPTLPLPPALPGMPRVNLEPKRPVLLPRLVLDETLGEGVLLNLPEAHIFVTGEKMKDKGIDVNQPPPLPTQSQPVPDRASLEDPTLEASIVAAVAAKVPLRTGPVPFQRVSIPDPFENYNPVRLSQPPTEDSQPPVGPARNPKP